MERKYFILFLFVIIYQVVSFERVYCDDNVNETSTAETENCTTLPLISDGNFTVEITESLADDNTTVVTSATVDISTRAPRSLPKLPEAFQARIRLSVLSRSSSTYNVILSYDLKKNRAAVTKTVGQHKSREIYDFSNSRILNIKDGSCVVDEISENSTEDIQFPFPFYVGNGQKKMKGPLSIFRLDGNDTDVAEEEISVSGVPCMEFNNTIDVGYVDKCRKNIFCKIRHFYSNAEWKNPNCMKTTFCGPVPVRIEVECGDNPLFCNYMRFSVSFFEFYEGIKNEEEFQQLPGIYCEDKATASEPFPTIPMSFHAVLIERNLLDNSLKTEKIWWNEPENILRLDTFVGNEIMSIIKDYNRNLSYNITKLDTACTTVYRYEEKPSIFSLLLNLKSEDREGIQKVGKRKCELSVCEVWVVKSGEGKTFEVYLKKQISNRKEYYVPVLVDSFRSNEVPAHYARKTFKGYRSSLGEWSAFDVTPCFADKCFTNFKLTVKGDIGERWKSSSFRENIYHTIWNHSKIISPLRLQKLQIIPETNETITMRGTIIDDVYMIEKLCLKYRDISSENALRNIQEMLNQEGIFLNGEGYQMKITSFSVDVPPTDEGGKKYGPGDMGGLAIGMLIGGMTCGAAVVLVIIRVRKRK